MTAHAEIVRRCGISALHTKLKDSGVDITRPRIERWAERNSIPSPFFFDLARLKVATLDELAEGAKQAVIRRRTSA